jgi:hypothetical protein
MIAKLIVLAVMSFLFISSSVLYAHALPKDPAWVKREHALHPEWDIQHAVGKKNIPEKVVLPENQYFKRCVRIARTVPLRIVVPYMTQMPPLLTRQGIMMMTGATAYRQQREYLMTLKVAMI